MFSVPSLPFAETALQPDMSPETLRLHHGAHHAGYVEKLNALVADTVQAGLALEHLIETSRRSAQPHQQAVFNNAGQHWNHSFFWESLSPNGNDGPSGALADRIAQDFGTFATLRELFVRTGRDHFGSGWIWLAVEGGRLTVITTHDGECPVGTDATPLLCCDLWEHAYYLDHQNRRDAFLEAFIGRLANWPAAEARFADLPAGEVASKEPAKPTGDAPDPRSQFGSPELLVESETLGREQKIAMLEQWHLDLDNRLKAEEEGMSASDPMRATQESRLADEAARVKSCLATLSDRTGEARQGS